MIQIMPETKKGLLCLQASQKLSDKDYKSVIIPEIQKAIDETGKIRVILFMDKTFEGWEPKAFWDDTKMGLGNATSFEKFGLVGGPGWIKAVMYLFGMATHIKVKHFEVNEYQDAVKWMAEE